MTFSAGLPEITLGIGVMVFGIGTGATVFRIETGSLLAGTEEGLHPSSIAIAMIVICALNKLLHLIGISLHHFKQSNG
jgi:hypothetical protein